MILFARREIHSSWGNEKKVKQDSSEFSRLLTAERISNFCTNVPFLLLQK
jgi:hypothetical protein